MTGSSSDLCGQGIEEGRKYREMRDADPRIYADPRPYAQTDVRRTQPVGSTLRPPPSAPLDELQTQLTRIHSTALDRLRNTIDMLNSHADRVHGPVPEEATNGLRTDRRDHGNGALGVVRGITDDMERSLDAALDQLYRAAERNTNLA